MPAAAPVEAAAKAEEKAAADGLKKTNKLSTTEGGDIMPGFDRTGPMGVGPMTGGARGRCNPITAETIPAFAGGYGYGRGLALRRGFRGGYGPGRGRGRGYGRGFGWYPPALGPAYSMDAASELDMLKTDAEYMQKSLNAINKRIDELSEKPDKES